MTSGALYDPLVPGGSRTVPREIGRRTLPCASLALLTDTPTDDGQRPPGQPAASIASTCPGSYAPCGWGSGSCGGCPGAPPGASRCTSLRVTPRRHRPRRGRRRPSPGASASPSSTRGASSPPGGGDGDAGTRARGTAMMLVHGWEGAGAAPWVCGPSRPRGYDVVADHVGHGDPAASAARCPPCPDTLRAVAQQTLDDLGLDPRASSPTPWGRLPRPAARRGAGDHAGLLVRPARRSAGVLLPLPGAGHQRRSPRRPRAARMGALRREFEFRRLVETLTSLLVLHASDDEDVPVRAFRRALASGAHGGARWPRASSDRRDPEAIQTATAFLVRNLRPPLAPPSVVSHGNGPSMHWIATLARTLALLLLCIGLGGAVPAQADAEPHPLPRDGAHHARDGPIDAGHQALFRRAVVLAKSSGAPLIIAFDTPGGELARMRQLRAPSTRR